MTSPKFRTSLTPSLMSAFKKSRNLPYFACFFDPLSPLECGSCIWMPQGQVVEPRNVPSFCPRFKRKNSLLNNSTRKCDLIGHGLCTWTCTYASWTFVKCTQQNVEFAISPKSSLFNVVRQKWFVERELSNFPVHKSLSTLLSPARFCPAVPTFLAIVSALEVAWFLKNRNCEFHFDF